MIWDILSTISEMLSAIAILVTLIYLAIQTKQSAKAVQASTRQEILASDQQFIMYAASNPEMEFIRYKPQLSDEEKIRLGFFLTTFVRIRENNWLQHKNGVLDDASWDTYRRSIAVMLGPASARNWWRHYSSFGIYDPEFVSEVNKTLAAAPVQQESRLLKAFDE
jgi:hypothetical protein